MIPELSRTLSVDRLPAAFTVEASAAECVAVAARLRIPEVRTVTCRFELSRRGDVVTAHGRLRAEVVQSCVVTLEPVTETVDDTFTVRLVPAGTEADNDDPDSPDELPYDGSAIDLGETAVEQLALSLDPYPRAPGAVMDASSVDVEETPFARLSALRRPM